MTSEERREARYQRRVERRTAKKIQSRACFDDFDIVFSYDNLYKSYKKCRRNVAWKASVQKYITQAPMMVNQTYTRLQEGKFKSSGFYEFDINERGKIRHIKSVTVVERVVQRCLCDNALVPMLAPTFIYDNAASLENRGYHFSIRRMCRHLHEHYQKHGTEGYILLFDFSKFFDNVSHELCKQIMKEQFTDERIIALTEHFIDCFGDIGLGLGSQISQTFALASANRLDHYVKEVLRIRGYGRYMDDGYLIHESKEYLHHCMDEIRKICKELGITLNEKKTQIVKISHGFTFLKTRFTLTKTGKVVRRIYKKSVVRERRKLKKFVPLLESGVMTYTDIYTSFQSWSAYAKNFNAWHTLQNMCKLYNQLFIDPWIISGGDIKLLHKKHLPMGGAFLML
ncbi:MAG: Reverse transcriptase (RNA-dependent DNA polymerase) [Eubacterium sp.]|nr:Reverse transcriptase (RNA-dependent DNA polymerase) [Eubacterium sp.]